MKRMKTLPAPTRQEARMTRATGVFIAGGISAVAICILGLTILKAGLNWGARIEIALMVGMGWIAAYCSYKKSH
jgi:hypothetical protein